jgi:hypothetical protein
MTVCTRIYLHSHRSLVQAAMSLLESLGSEKITWAHQAALVHSQQQRAVGDCLIAAALVSYCGQFSEEQRERLLQIDAVVDLAARDVAVTQNLSLVRIYVVLMRIILCVCTCTCYDT